MEILVYMFSFFFLLSLWVVR